MAYKQKLGPLRRAGYDKDAASPFHQDTDSTSGVELDEFVGKGTHTSNTKDDIKQLIKDQKQYDVNTETAAQNLAEIDSLTRVAQGPEGAKQAKFLYGNEYTSKQPLGEHFTPRGAHKIQYDKLREEARKIQGPRPTL